MSAALRCAIITHLRRIHGDRLREGEQNEASIAGNLLVPLNLAECLHDIDPLPISNLTAIWELEERGTAPGNDHQVAHGSSRLEDCGCHAKACTESRYFPVASPTSVVSSYQPSIVHVTTSTFLVYHRCKERSVVETSAYGGKHEFVDQTISKLQHSSQDVLSNSANTVKICQITPEELEQLLSNVTEVAYVETVVDLNGKPDWSSPMSPLPPPLPDPPPFPVDQEMEWVAESKTESEKEMESATETEQHETGTHQHSNHTASVVVAADATSAAAASSATAAATTTTTTITTTSSTITTTAV
jgi:hypothetical protein